MAKISHIFVSTKQPKPHTQVASADRCLKKMKAISIIRVSDVSDKAVKILLREGGYDLNNFKVVNEVSLWVPKSVSKIEGDTIHVEDWFFKKNMQVDTYKAFMSYISNY